MKNDHLNGLLYISTNGATSHINKVKFVVTKATEKYDLSQWHYKPKKSCDVMTSDRSVAVQIYFRQQHLLNQMECCIEQLDEKYLMQTRFSYKCNSDESESDMDDDF